MQTDIDGWVTSEGRNNVLLIAPDFDHRFLPNSVHICTHEKVFAAAASSYSIARDGGSLWRILQHDGTPTAKLRFDATGVVVAGEGKNQ